LRGRTLQVDPNVAPRTADFVQVVLPDSSRTVLPIGWTNLASDDNVSRRNLRFTANGLRLLAQRIKAMANRS
jgi:hypothetical protein